MHNFSVFYRYLMRLETFVNLTNAKEMNNMVKV